MKLKAILIGLLGIGFGFANPSSAAEFNGREFSVSYNHTDDGVAVRLGARFVF